MPKSVKVALFALACMFAGATVIVAIVLAMNVPDPGQVAQPTITQHPTTAASPELDPYEVWLTRAPEDAPELSREDALVRATLGCGQNWPPGTVDAILAEVYADYVSC
jgi:hypothetical protein